MGRHRNTATGVVVSVDDSKDGRFADGWESPDQPATAVPTATAKKTAARKPD